MQTLQTSAWLQRCANAHETGMAIRNIAHGPMVAYNKLGFTPAMVHATRQFDFERHFAHQKQSHDTRYNAVDRAFSLHGLNGSNKERAAAHREIFDNSVAFFPAEISGTRQIAQCLSNNFSQLARGLNARRMQCYWRAEAPKEGDDDFHLDGENQYVAIASITPHETTQHASPATYTMDDVRVRGDLYGAEYVLRNTPAREAAVASAPQLSIAVWRGRHDMRPSAHRRRDLTSGTRALCLGVFTV